MTPLTEKTNEESLLQWLSTLDWGVYGGPSDHGRGGALLNDAYDRTTDESILWTELREKLIDLNSMVTAANVETVIEGIKGDIALTGSQSLLEVNQTAHDLLTTGRQTRVEFHGVSPAAH